MAKEWIGCKGWRGVARGSFGRGRCGLVVVLRVGEGNSVR
jgi:hypothetical protein